MADPQWAAGWTPAAETRVTEIAAHPVAGLAACLDADPQLVEAGQPLPPLWHWVALSQWPAGSATGPDGHPTLGGFLPTTPYPRRMWVGCSVDLHAPAPVGTPVVAERVVESLDEKTGRQGTFALVTVKTTVTSAAGELLLTERTQLAYRGHATSPAPAAVDVPSRSGEPASGWLIQTEPWTWRLQPSPPMLMMFSALTANAHRIHYDVPYTRDVEGYPSLLVHGPLMAIALAEVVRREQPERQVATITCRALRPMFLGAAAEIRRAPADQTEPEGNGVHLELATDGTHMTAAVTFVAD